MLNRTLLFSAFALSGLGTAVAAQNPAGAPPACRVWSGKTMVGPKDSVLTTWALVSSADGKTWRMKFPGRDAIPVRVLATGGDSMVTEMGPYSSISRPGQMVTTRTTAHIQGKEMTGTFEAHFVKGDVLRGKHTAICKM
jgi:hypothetical protein